MMKRQKFVIGNWKMSGNLASINHLLDQLVHDFPVASNATCVVLPPMVYLSSVYQRVEKTPVHMGAQNLYFENAGAFTGEVSGPMLRDVGCEYVLVGHSERRRLFNENEKMLNEKFHSAKVHGMIPILCVGETQQEREAGITEEVLRQQLRIATQSTVLRPYMIAYEPVWAIGTGKTPEPQDIQQVHAFIRAQVATQDPMGAQTLPIIYGGSLTGHNSLPIFSMPDVDGGLIGAASLDAQKFLDILKCINLC